MELNPAETRFIRADRLLRVRLDGGARRRIRERARNEVRLRFFETSIAVAFDDAEAAALFRKRYRAFGSDETAALRIFAVHVDGGALFFVDDGAAYRWDGSLHARGLEFLADGVTRELYFGATSRRVSFHAAACAAGEVAFAVTAASEGGKTTTAIACARRGMPLYSDEFCILEKGAVQPYPRALNLREGSLALLGSECSGDPVTSRIRARCGKRWRDVSFAEIFGTVVPPAPRPLVAVFFIDGRAPQPAIEGLGSAEALPRLLAAPLQSRGDGPSRISHAIEILANTRAFRLTLGTPDATALAIRESVRTLGYQERCA